MLLFKRSHSDQKKNVCDVIFAIPCYLIESFAPFLALYSILVKVKQLGFAVEGMLFLNYAEKELIVHIINR